jgi:hypothetical protein
MKWGVEIFANGMLAVVQVRYMFSEEGFKPFGRWLFCLEFNIVCF